MLMSFRLANAQSQFTLVLHICVTSFNARFFQAVVLQQGVARQQDPNWAFKSADVANGTQERGELFIPEIWAMQKDVWSLS